MAEDEQQAPLPSDPGAVEEIVEAEATEAGVEQRTDARLAGPLHDARLPFLTGALIAVAVGAVFLLGGQLLGARDERRGDDGPTWSQWKPTKDGSAGAEQIARRVGGRYRKPGGGQLVRVEGGELEIAGLPLTVALRQPQSSGDDVELFEGDGVLYRLCGLGANCAITTGKPSVERHLLLRRQALELALYSFRYLDGLDHVVVFMPPKPGDEPGQALFFRRDQMAEALDRPLDATLVDRTPSVERVLRSPDTLLVEQLTIPMLFRFRLTQADRDDRALLVLEPFNSPPPEQYRPQDPRSGRSNAALTDPAPPPRRPDAG